MSARPAVATRGLVKRYGDLTAVDDLDLEVAPGTCYGFLGPNGAGKTTTIRVLLGLVHATGGEARVLGEAVTPGRGTAVLRRVGALIEEPAFYGYLSGRANLELSARAGGPRADVRARLARVGATLETVDLADAAGKKVKAYSQGMRQRLGLARALLGEPELLVLDEPTNGLDPAGIAEVRGLLRRLADAGTTVFVSSHLLAEVEALCDRVAVVADGRLVAEGPPATLTAGAGRLRVVVGDAAGARGAVDGLAASVEGPTAGEAALRLLLAADATAADVTAALVHAGVAVHEVTGERARLEDVFLELTGGHAGR